MAGSERPPTLEHAMKLKTLVSLSLIALSTTFSPAAHAQTFSVIYYFGGGTSGEEPAAGVTIRGNAIYGTTSNDAYELTHLGSNWLFSSIAGFSSYPLARVVFGPDGHLYGTTWNGGTYGYGTVFKLTPPLAICKSAACYWTVSDLHDFGSGTDGQGPENGDLIWDQQGNIYGTTPAGGTSGDGTVYELTPSGNGYTESVLYNFSGPDRAGPFGGLVFDNQGNLFGTTTGGGPNHSGTVFELTYVVGVGWTEQVLYDFQHSDDPAGGLIFDSSGNLYGTTTDGGNEGAGSVFELSPSGDTWTFNLLYSFKGKTFCGPRATLSMDGAGSLYGTTYCSGAHNSGNVFELTNIENTWVYTSLYDFTGHNDGASPISNVSIDSDGTLYGTASEGGSNDLGVVWMIKP